MNFSRFLLLSFGWLLLVNAARAHRSEGLLQSALVEVLPTRVNVEITFEPGIDIARTLVQELDTNRDGIWNESESATWADAVLEELTVQFDTIALTPRFVRIEASPFSEFRSGHAEIKVQFTAELPRMAQSLQKHTLTVGNQYAFKNLASTYQIHGIVPKAPGVRIEGHTRDANQQSITLQTLLEIAPTAFHQSP